MIAYILLPVLFLLGVVIGSVAGCYVAYQEGVEDERRGWYIHAHSNFHKIEEFEKSKED